MPIGILMLYFCSYININSCKSHFCKVAAWLSVSLCHPCGVHQHHSSQQNSKAPHISALHVVHKTCLAAFSKHKTTDYGLLRDFSGSAGVQTGILAKEHIYTKPYFPLSVTWVILNAVIQLQMIQMRRNLFHTSSSNIVAIDEFIKTESLQHPNCYVW